MKSAKRKFAQAWKGAIGCVMERLEERMQLSVSMELASVSTHDLYHDVNGGNAPIDTMSDSAVAIAIMPTDVYLTYPGFAAAAQTRYPEYQVDLYLDGAGATATRVPVRSIGASGVTTYDDGALSDEQLGEARNRYQPTVQYDQSGTLHFAYVVSYYDPVVGASYALLTGVPQSSQVTFIDKYVDVSQSSPLFAKGSNGQTLSYGASGDDGLLDFYVAQGTTVTPVICGSSSLMVRNGSAALGPAGELYVAYTRQVEFDTGQGTIETRWALYAGPLANPQLIYTYPADQVSHPEQPVIDVDRSDSALQGSVYVAFSTGEAGDTTTASLVRVAMLPRGWAAWGIVDVDPLPPANPGDPQPVPHQHIPWMEVDEKTGGVHVIYVNNGDTVRGAVSPNGALAFYTDDWGTTLGSDRVGVAARAGSVCPIWVAQHDNTTARVGDGPCITTATGRWRVSIDGAPGGSDIRVGIEPDTGGKPWLVVRQDGEVVYTGLPGAIHDIAIDGSGAHLEIATGDGSDWVSVDGSTIVWRLLDGAGNPVGVEMTISYTNVADITINTDGGDDILTQVGQPSAPLVFNGGTDADTLDVQAGTFTFDSDALVGTSSLAINVSGTGSVVFNASQHIRALNIQGGGATLSAGGSKVLVTQSLSMATSGGSYLGYLDLTDNDMIIKSDAANVQSVLDSTTAMIASGRNANPTRWTGSGVRSSTAASAPGGLTGLGITRNLNDGTPIFTTFDGELVDQYSVIVKYTWNGDADLNGMIDGSDYFLIDKGFLSRNLTPPLTGWHWGDFDYNGIIDGSDYFLIDKASMVQDGTLL